MARKPRKSREEADPEDAESENEESVQKITKVWAQNLYSDINQHLIEFLIKNKLTQQIEETLKKQRMNIYKISELENKNKKKILTKGLGLNRRNCKKKMNIISTILQQLPKQQMRKKMTCPETHLDTSASYEE